MLNLAKINRRGARRKLEMNEETLRLIDELARIHCTQREAAAVLGVSESGFALFLKSNSEARNAWDDGRASGRASLRRLQAEMAATNPQMAIWLGKQLLGQRDTTHNINVDEDGPNKIVADKQFAEDRARVLELLQKLRVEVGPGVCACPDLGDGNAACEFPILKQIVSPSPRQGGND